MSALLVFSLSASAEEKNKEQEEMMKKWQEYSTPTEAHKLLATMAGKWSYTSSMWETKDSKPMESKGTANFKMIMNGRYLQQEFSGKAMGQPFQGLGFTGYDNLKKKTNSVWMDNMGSAIMMGSGEMNLEKKMISESGEFTCPRESDGTAGYRNEWTMVDNKTMTFTMYHRPDKGDEYKSLEINYKRIK
jgi:hypothetical protein